MSTRDEILAELDSDVKALQQRGPNRFVAPGGTAEYAQRVADQGPAWGRDLGSKGVAEPRDYASLGESKGLARAIQAIATHDVRGLTPTWQSKALAESTDSSGGYLLPVQVSSDVAMLIRSRTAVLNLGPTTVTPTSKEYDLPGLSAGASAAWVPENASIPPSAQQFQINSRLRPHALASLVAISNRLLHDAVADPSIEQVVMSDMADVLAVTLDAALLSGTGTGGQPLGITASPGLATPPPVGTNGSQVSYPFLQSIPAVLRASSSQFQRPGWILHPRTLTSILTLTDSLGRPLIENSNLLSVNPTGASGLLLGFPFFTSAQLPVNLTQGSATNASQIIFSSDWQEAYFGQWEGLAMVASGEAAYTTDGGTTWVSSFQSLQTLYRASQYLDFTLRRPERFVVVNGIVP